MDDLHNVIDFILFQESLSSSPILDNFLRLGVEPLERMLKDIKLANFFTTSQYVNLKRIPSKLREWLETLLSDLSRMERSPEDMESSLPLLKTSLARLRSIISSLAIEIRPLQKTRTPHYREFNGVVTYLLQWMDRDFESLLKMARGSK